MDRVGDLRELIMTNNLLRLTEGLWANKLLTTLNLGYNKIEKIDSLNNLVKLTSLNLEGNLIESIQGLESLRELKILNLSKNKINAIGFLPAFPKV